jgi:hypothetical protein
MLCRIDPVVFRWNFPLRASHTRIRQIRRWNAHKGAALPPQLGRERLLTSRLKKFAGRDYSSGEEDA